MFSISIDVSLCFLFLCPQVAGLPVPRQQFGEAVKQPGITFAVARFDGVLGMAYPSIAVANVVPVFDTAMAAKLLPQNIFSFYISRLVSDKRIKWSDKQAVLSDSVLVKFVLSIFSTATPKPSL